MKRLMAAATLSLLIGCNGGGTPTPTPTPPEATPTPPPATPPKDVPVGAERLLRNEANKFLRTNEGVRFDPFGAEPCCDGWSRVPNQRWPLASEAFMHETGIYGANLFHFRIGPWFSEQETEWADIGGAYLPDGSWNEAYWQKVRDLVWHAYRMGAYVEVVPVDDWWLKGACGKDRACSKRVPWTQAAVEAWGKTPHVEAEALYRKTVAELGNFGNVIWATGNEEDLIPGTTVAHLNWRIAVIRDAEQQTTGKFVHIIGSGSDKSGVNKDYQITHDCGIISGPVNGMLAAQNECNDSMSPEMWASRFSQARRAGQRWDAWRADASEADWEKRLRLFRDVVNGESPGCFPPSSNDPLWGQPAEGPGFEKATVQAAQAVVGERCGTDHAGSLATLDALGVEVRKQGKCAGRLDDALFVLASDGQWEEYHAVAFSTGCWANDPKQYPKLRWPYHGTNPEPQPACVGSVPVPDELLCHEAQATNHIWDCTLKDNGQPIRPEGDPTRPACEAKACGGIPTFSIDSTTLALTHRANPYQFKLSGTGTGILHGRCPATGMTDLIGSKAVTQ